MAGQGPADRGEPQRRSLDVALYAGVLAAALYLLVGDGEAVAGLAAGRLDPAAIAVLLGLWALLGLRDKVPFLAGRPEIYGFLLVVSLFPIDNLIVGWQLVFICIWWGAAASKLNHHFPYVIAVMVVEHALEPLAEDEGEALREPSRRPAALALREARRAPGHGGRVRPAALLLVTSGGPIGTFAVIGMLLFHIHITSTFALGVPLEWNLFMIFGLLFLFGHYGDVPLSTLDDPLLLVVILAIGVAIPVFGNLFPEKISFLPGMRYYAGNWATSHVDVPQVDEAPRGGSTRACRRSRRSRSSRSPASTTGRRPSS